MYKKIIKNKHGSAMLLMTFLILASILIISLSLSAIVVNGLKMGVTQTHSTKAFFAAEAGAEKILWQIRKNGYNPGDGAGVGECDNTEAAFCFSDNGDGLINQCTSGGCSNEDFQQLSNNSIYKIRFKYDGVLLSPTKLISYGNYNNEINRIIELQY